MSRLIAVLRRGLFALDVTLPFPVAAPAPRRGWADRARAVVVSSIQRSWVRIRGPIDPLLVEASARGELAVARVRLGMAAALLVIPVSALVASRQTENLIGLGAALAAVLLSLLVDSLVTRGLYRHWFSVVTSAVDVSIVSASLAAFLVLVDPHTAVNSKVVFECYFLALGAATLRYDVRICLFAGLLALVQYAVIVLVASTYWSLHDPRFAPFPHGMFSWTTQLSRFILLASFSVLAAVVVKRSWQLRYLSATDRLTGLYNRSQFNDYLVAEVARSQRHRSPFSIVMIDVDRFKALNDTHGHPAGDAALQLMASMLRQSFRAGDVVARYGGEEFVVLMRETSKAQAIERLEVVRHAIEATPCILSTGAGPIGLTISIGTACFPEDGVSEHQLLSCADRRLLAAKAHGRNCIVAG